MKKIIAILALITFFLSNASFVAYAHTEDVDFYEAFEHHGSVMIIIDSKTGEIIHVNEAASNFYGYKIEQLESMKIQDLSTLTPDETKKRMQEVVGEKKHDFILEHRLANGEIRTVEINSYPYVSGNKTLLIGIVNDITEKTRLEKKERMLTVVLLGIVILLLLFSFIILKNSRKLKANIAERKLAQDQIIGANEQLEDANKQLQEKQYSLEEQNAVIEELNSQLEDENERYQRQKETLQAIIDSLGAGIVMVDLEGKVTFINEAWKGLFSYLDFDSNYYSKDNFYINNNTSFGTELFIRKMLSGMENKDEICTRLINLTQDRNSRYTVDMEQSSPMNRFLNLYSNPCVSYAGHTFGRVFVARDVSHQKEVDRLKLELISTVSHELRTPMSSILGFSELLLTRKLSEERHKEYASIINSEARRLTDLINDFLDIQRMESGKQVFNKQINSIDQIIEEAVKLFENIDDKHDIVYEKNKEDKPQIYCDRDKMLQVLSNLLSNAIKYSPDGGEIKVDFTVENTRVKVSVADHGLGIPEDVKDKLFTKFFRVDNDDRRKIGGSGLGLAISKEIIRAHGGEIGVDSTYGQGSTFYFCLPLLNSKISNDDVDKVNNDSCIANNGQLLIVEDDASMVKLIREILKGECLEMHSTSSGEEAMRLAKEYDYRLFILDIALKGRLNGWDVVKALKSDYSTADTPIIISSVYENKNNISCSDISDYLVKPFEPEQMVKVVRKALSGNLNSKMMVNSDEKLKEEILCTLNSKGINIKSIEHSGNMLIITLDGEEGLLNE